ncbi:MAG: hypothetical protein C4576_33575 [Desulfobacteraceae bacterium]|nr:MAG: hypothetical protein C4576_33575 [Desulfobacteraceae bacterium]
MIDSQGDLILQEQRGVDPFLCGKLSKKNGSLPYGSIHLFTIAEKDTIAESKSAYYLHENESCVEIWKVNEYVSGVVARKNRPERNLKQFIMDNLIEVFISIQFRFDRKGLIDPGYLSAQEYDDMQRVLQSVLKRCRTKRFSRTN